MRPIVLWLACLALVSGCKDAQPGTLGQGGMGGSAAIAGGGGSASEGSGAGSSASQGDGGAASAGGGDAGGGAAGGSTHEGGAPDFANAASVGLPSPAEEATFNDHYGFSVAVSGDTVLVGAYRDHASLVVGGAAHVFAWNGGGYDVQASLRALEPQANSYFGWAVAIDRDVAAVGAPAYSTPSDAAGAGYLMTRNGTSWVSQQLVQQDPPQAYGKLGGAVAVSGSSALVSAPDIPERVFVYELNGATWSLTGELVADDPVQQFGVAVALDGDTAVVAGLPLDGAPAAHVFVRTGGAWEEQGRLVPGNGDPDFGLSVSVSGDHAVVGSGSQAGPGSAHVFSRTGGTWQQRATLLAEDGAEGDAFGASVAMSGDVIVVGASGHDGLASNAGAAYTFVRSDDDWAPQATLVRPGGGADERFGTAVEVHGAVAVVGGVNATTGRGTATVFRAPLP